MLPGVRLEQIGQQRCLTTRSTSWDMLRGFNHRCSKSSGTSKREHVRPPALPHQRHLATHVRRRLSCLRVGQRSDHLRGFIAPAPACFNGHDDQFAAAGRCHLRVCHLLVCPRFQQHRTICVCCVRVCLAFATQHTAQRNVHGELRAPETRKVLGKDFDLPCVLGAHLDVHVLEEHVLPHSRSCLTDNAGHRLLCGSGALLHPSAARA